MALKSCQECSSPFEKRKKDLEKLKEKKTNITQQRHLMESRVRYYWFVMCLSNIKVHNIKYKYILKVVVTGFDTVS